MVNAFIRGLQDHLAAGSSLFFDGATPSGLKLPAATASLESRAIPADLSRLESYDLIVANLPLGLDRIDATVGSAEIRVRRNWAQLAELLSHLSPNGVCLALLEPPGFGTSEGPRFETALNGAGYFVHGYVTSEELSLADTPLQPVICVITKEPSEDVFVAELVSSAQAGAVAEALLSRKVGQNLVDGVTIEPLSFIGFKALQAEQQLDQLQTQYKEYRTRPLQEIAVAFNGIRDGCHTESPNAIYIPLIGTSSVTSDLDQVTLKHHNVVQVILEESTSSKYLSAFFQSDLGKLILNSVVQGAVIQKRRISDLKRLLVPLPDRDEQLQIVAAHALLERVTTAIQSLQRELALNPRNNQAVDEMARAMLEQVGRLTDADRIMAMVRGGESTHVEFKETLSVDVRKASKQRYIEDMALKNVTAFINTEGGTLLVGVADSGEILGVGSEVSTFYGSIDRFLLHLKNLLRERIGEQFYPFISSKLVRVSGADVLMIDCLRGPTPCYLDGKEFYVRTNPATDKLEGPKLVEYVKNHFGP